MPNNIECPRCKTPLRVSRKLAGAYVQCPHCKVRLWVAKDATAEPARADGADGASDSGTVPAAVPPSPVPSAVPPPKRKPAKPPPTPDVPPAPSQVPARRKKVAPFISAETADSALRLAADGKLPALHLEEDIASEKTETKSRSVNPLIMLALLSFSVVLSVALALVDWGEPSDSSGSHQKSVMRQKIEDNYFGSDSAGNTDLEPYQLLLREAQRAYTRGDHQTERNNYRKVLDMLRAERGSHERGLTGSRSRDRELEEAISVLLSDS